MVLKAGRRIFGKSTGRLLQPFDNQGKRRDVKTLHASVKLLRYGMIKILKSLTRISVGKKHQKCYSI